MALARDVGSLALKPLLLLYQIIQFCISKCLAPSPPRPRDKPTRPKIAVIGAGLTGVSAAAHCAGHGFDVHIFEAGKDAESVGGIWSRVNDTSGLQINSIMYRFHPALNWERGYPERKQIVSQIRRLWKTYGLERRTTFDFKVEKVYKDDKGRWIINDPSHGRYDGVVAAVGTCGDPKMPHMPGQDQFKGAIYHSSELTGKDAKGKNIAIIGGGASAVEALEFAFSAGASKTSILARSDKWVLPRNLFVNALMSFNIFGQETFLSFIPEFLLRKLFYRDLQDLAPTDKGVFEETPMVNSEMFDKLREGKADWVRCDVEELVEGGVRVNRRAQGVPKGGPGHQQLIDADIIIMATGYKRPSLSFLPDDCFQEPYTAPKWYLQTFPTNHPSICAINCTYINAIGTVGHFHIGIYTRILLMFLVDPLTRPRKFWMERWIDMTSLLKRTAPTGAFDFFTYLELLWWFVFVVLFNPFRWKWLLFVFFGVGLGLPTKVVEHEERVLADEGGYKHRDEGRSL
ncbi:hypothetical protein S40288_08723 [Stachybotrys chartarum IBT 40288]|nr:hypothetical protein S40288_08723 [Stachybotrys chartarum IBT 40288]